MICKKTVSVVLAVIFLAMCFPINAIAASEIKGDANGDGTLSVSDAAYIARCLSRRQTITELIADYNNDGKVDISDAAGIARTLANVSYKTYAQKILALVNEEREKAGVSPLTLNVSLVTAADVRATEIVNTFSHTRPDNTSFSTVFDELNISYYCCGENIAAGLTDAEMVMDQWVNSSKHYENIINPQFTQLGVGYYYDEASTYKHHWVQLFKCD